MGDAVTTSQGALYNFDMAAVYRRFLRTIKDTQLPTGDVAPAVPDKGSIKSVLKSGLGAYGNDGRADISWTCAYPLITRRLLKYYGDDTPAREHWDSLVLYMDGLYAQAKNQSCPGNLPNFSTWGE